jgi:hypothetical protein
MLVHANGSRGTVITWKPTIMLYISKLLYLETRLCECNDVIIGPELHSSLDKAILHGTEIHYHLVVKRKSPDSYLQLLHTRYFWFMGVTSL